MPGSESIPQPRLTRIGCSDEGQDVQDRGGMRDDCADACGDDPGQDDVAQHEAADGREDDARSCSRHSFVPYWPVECFDRQSGVPPRLREAIPRISCRPLVVDRSASAGMKLRAV